jgi:hypothetical protein
MNTSNAFISPDEAGMLDSNSNDNDTCIRADTKKVFVLLRRPANIFANWYELPSPDAALAAATYAQDTANNANIAAQSAYGEAMAAQSQASAALAAANAAQSGGLSPAQAQSITTAQTAATQAQATANAAQTAAAQAQATANAAQDSSITLINHRQTGGQIYSDNVVNTIKSDPTKTVIAGNAATWGQVLELGSAGSNEYYFKALQAGRYEVTYSERVKIVSSADNFRSLNLLFTPAINNPLTVLISNTSIKFCSNGTDGTSITGTSYIDLVAGDTLTPKILISMASAVSVNSGSNGAFCLCIKKIN